MPQTKKAKGATPKSKVKAVKATKPAAKTTKAKPEPKVAAKPTVKAKVKAIEKSKTALKKETSVKTDEVKVEAQPVVAAVSEKPAKAPKAPKVPKMSASAIAKAEKATDAANALSQKWGSLYKKAESIESKPYNMRAVFEEKTAIIHKVLGWGYILANKNDRLEVLFKDGIKYLISNYKPA